MKRAKKREQKEKRENEKRYDYNCMKVTNSTPNNNLPCRKSLLEVVQVHVVSSDISSSDDDGAGQLSNLRAIALIENETRRYVYSNLKNDTSTPNNILLHRQEKAKAKKRKRRYPSYSHLFGEYTFTTQSAWGHLNIGEGVLITPVITQLTEGSTPIN